jgi:hypothetical protein
LRRCGATAGTENVSSPALELRLPRCDLIGMHVEQIWSRLSEQFFRVDK